MALSFGIVGLPNVGKSTLFNALSSAKAEAANYPFCTIEPERRRRVRAGRAPRRRSTRSSTPSSIVPTTINFVDIAGLVRGASKGEGLGNQFLSHIREVDAIVQVVRCFEDAERRPRREQGRPGRRHRDRRRPSSASRTSTPSQKRLDRAQDGQGEQSAGEKLAAELCERSRSTSTRASAARVRPGPTTTTQAVVREMQLLTGEAGCSTSPTSTKARSPTSRANRTTWRR